MPTLLFLLGSYNSKFNIHVRKVFKTLKNLSFLILNSEVILFLFLCVLNTLVTVLTTMFINVSNNLPTTSYMKMVDIWLLFNLILPFIVVLIHTYMDTLRNDEDREINHHGKSVSVDDKDSSLIKV